MNAKKNAPTQVIVNGAIVKVTRAYSDGAENSYWAFDTEVGHVYLTPNGWARRNENGMNEAASVARLPLD